MPNAKLSLSGRFFFFLAYLPISVSLDARRPSSLVLFSPPANPVRYLRFQSKPRGNPASFTFSPTMQEKKFLRRLICLIRYVHFRVRFSARFFHRVLFFVRGTAIFDQFSAANLIPARSFVRSHHIESAILCSPRDYQFSGLSYVSRCWRGIL